MLIDGFENPPVENRPRPFWFFNGGMERDEVRHQILEMKDKGLGGFFICARQGLRVPYLSNEWFELCKFAVDTARENGLEVWLYDEYPYPSGMSGGEVTIRHPEAKQKILELKVLDVEEGAALNESLGEGSLLFAKAWPVVWRKNEKSIEWEKPLDISGHCGILQIEEIYQKTEGGTSYRHNFKRYFSYGPSRELRWKPVQGAWKVLLAFTRELEGFKYYGTFLDPANEDAVQCFIDTTYEPYRNALGENFGKTVKGIFGDETSFLEHWPWSNQFPGYFQKKYGFSLIENLGALIDSSYPHAKRIRYCYFQCVHELLRDRYHKPLSQWCEKNGLRYAAEVPSVRMSNQIYSHVPGGDPCHDKLGYPFNSIIDRDFLFLRQNPKAISAMARQFDRRDSLVEAFHSIGWTATLQDMKWQIDRLTLAGISLHNFHAYYYTVNGITKHDAPPSQFLQNPYWEYYKTFADYCARSSRFITETEASISVAILHPAIVWCTELRHPFHRFDYMGYDTEEKKRGRKLIDDYLYICKTLFLYHIDYDDLDPEVLASAAIEKGMIQAGRAKYSILIVPPITCIEKYCFDLILKFLDKGGKVIFTGLTPFDSIEENFDPSSAFEEAGIETLDRETYFGPVGPSQMYQKTDNLMLLLSPGGLAAGNAGEKLAALIHAFAPQVSEVLQGTSLKEGIIVHRRKKGGTSFVMLASQNGEPAQTQVLFKDCPADAHFYELDLETGITASITPEIAGRGCLIKAPLSPWSARIFAMAREENKEQGIENKEKINALSPIQVFTQAPAKTLRLKLDLDKKLPVSLSGRNVYRLEEMTVSIAGSRAFTSKPNTFIEHLKESGSLTAGEIKFGDNFGIPQRLSVNYPLEAAYHFEFNIADDLIPDTLPPGVPALEILLMRDRMGIMGEHKVVVNGRELASEAWQPFRVYDQNNIAADLSPFVNAGQNTIDVFVTAAEDWHGLSDPMYLLGNFGVFREEGEFIIGKAPGAALPNAKAIEGFPFYSGKFFFETEIRIEPGKDHDLFIIELPEKYRIYECVELSINASHLGVRCFSPYVWQGPAELLKEGINKIKVCIINTLGNMLEGCYFDYDEQKTVYIGDIKDRDIKD